VKAEQRGGIREYSIGERRGGGALEKISDVAGSKFWIILSEVGGEEVTALKPKKRRAEATSRAQ